MNIDHATAEESAERPEGSLTRLAAVFEEDPYTLDGGKTMRVKARVYSTYREFLREAWQNIGVSIRGGGLGEYGTADGVEGLIVTELTEGQSVDFVTFPGAGGRIIALLESARRIRTREARNIEGWFEAQIHTDFTVPADRMYADGRLTRPERITLSSAIGDALAAFSARVEADAPQLASRDIYADPGDGTAVMSEAHQIREATAEETRQALCDAIQDTYGGDNPNAYVWVRDYDPGQGLVWYDAPDSGDQATWQQAYTATGTPLEVTLADTRTEVVARTVYDPAPPDAEDDAEPADADMTESATEPLAESAATPDVTDGAPPTVSTQPVEEGAGMTGTQNTGTVPDAAGTTDTAVSTAVNEAQTARRAAELALDESNRQRIAAETELARFRAVEAARPIVAGLLAESQVDTVSSQASVTAQVIAAVPLTESNALDETALRAAAATVIAAKEAELAEARQSAGAGTVSGLGSGIASIPDAAAVAATQTSMVESFRRLGLSEAAALVAAGGRH